jgi:hypothetical protein
MTACDAFFNIEHLVYPSLMAGQVLKFKPKCPFRPHRHPHFWIRGRGENNVIQAAIEASPDDSGEWIRKALLSAVGSDKTVS